MRLVRRGPADPGAAGEARRLGRIDRAGGKRAEPGLGHLDQPLMLDLAGGDQGDAAGAIAAAPPVVQILDRDGVDARLVAEDRAAERLVVIGGGPEIVEDDVGRRVPRLAQLLEDDVLLALEVGLDEMRVEDQVRDQLDSERDMLGEDRGHEVGRRRARSRR